MAGAHDGNGDGFGDGDGDGKYEEEKTQQGNLCCVPQIGLFNQTFDIFIQFIYQH